MTTMIKPVPVAVGSAEPDYDHLYCCDPDRAWCGADIGARVDHPEDCDHPECPLCWFAEPTLTCCCGDEEPTDA